MAPARPSARLFWTTASSVVLADFVTKLMAEHYLAPRYVPHRIIGDWLRFTLAYNPGAAFSMSLGVYSRYIFGAFAIIALVVLWRLYKMTGTGARAGDRTRIIALALAWGGAAGNLVDRFRSPHGVVDFIDIGYGNVRFWTFNIADSAVTVGALILAWSLSREDHDQRAQHAASAARVEPVADSPAPVLERSEGPDA
ncbi:MAG: signal peptidase II [Gemmatimonadaceae bacterium]